MAFMPATTPARPRRRLMDPKDLRNLMLGFALGILSLAVAAVFS